MTARRESRLLSVFVAAVADATALLIHVVVRPRARALPWLPVLGGRRVRPRLVEAALQLPTLILLWRAVLHLRLVFNGFRVPDDVTGVPAWSLWTQVALAWIWGASLVVVLLAYHRSTHLPSEHRAHAGR